MLSS
ncbi:hypothetical protein, partial [Achromobacter phage kwar_LB4]|jgi:hypothetical protein